jgi:hypothetical protein
MNKAHDNEIIENNAEQKTKSLSNVRVGQAFIDMKTRLDMLSRKEKHEVLTLLTSLEGFKVSSQFAPSVQTVPVPERFNRAGRQYQRPPAKAEWKSDPKWISAMQKHSEMVAEIKNLSSEDEKQPLIENLHKYEKDYLKGLKKDLQSFLKN